MEKKLISIVIPGRNEALNMPVLIERIHKVFWTLPEYSFEVLWVDDGSTDDTRQVISQLQKNYSWLILIRLAKNYGHQAALEAGIIQAKGQLIISLDGDCQHPPEEIPKMLQAHATGADVVQMVRKQPAKGFKGLFSKMFYQIFSLTTNLDIAMGGADFRLITRRIAEIIKNTPEKEKFLRVLLPSLGFNQQQLFYDEEDRHAGDPSYTFKSSFKLARKMFFEFSMFPLQFIFYVGLSLAALSFLAGCMHIIKKLIAGDSIAPGFTDIIVSILFLSGCILGSVGIIGRYIQMILEQVRGRPNYIIAEINEAKPEPTKQHD